MTVHPAASTVGPTAAPPALAVHTGLAVLADRYDAFLVDLWGTLHNGVAPYPGAVDCLRRLRDAGKTICLLSNAPRRSQAVVSKLRGLGVADDDYHLIVTSGEATWRALRYRPDSWHANLGEACFHLGPDRDLSVLEQQPSVRRVTSLEQATFVLNTGPLSYDDTLADYECVLLSCLDRGLSMVCANPDLIVEVGNRTVLCAGILAQRYEALGGTVRYHGKPDTGVYDLCLEALGLTKRDRVLGIGDSLRTDVDGGRAAGIHTALLAGGIHRDDFGCRWGDVPEGAAVAALQPESARQPHIVLPALKW